MQLLPSQGSNCIFISCTKKREYKKVGEEKGNSSPALLGNPLRDYSADLISTPPQSSAPFSTAKLLVEILPRTLAVRASTV